MSNPSSSWPGSTRPFTHLRQGPRSAATDARNTSGHDAGRLSAAPVVLRHPEKARRPDNPIPRKPDWLRVKAPGSPEYQATRRLMREHALNTVCEEAGCPNIYECWADRTATFMILGDRCTRACGFCLVDTRKPLAVDPGEPQRVADAVAQLGLAHAVITCVARDDLGLSSGQIRYGAILGAVAIAVAIVMDLLGKRPRKTG